MLVCLLVASMIVMATESGECVYDPKNFSTTSDKPISSLRNCLQYCQTFYNYAPQRTYYNITSQNCEPYRQCKNVLHYKDYLTNQCYLNQSLKTKTESYIPEAMVFEISITHESADMICVNGYYSAKKINGVVICKCQMLWKDSGLVNMKGRPFKCDVVSDNIEGHFFDSLTFDPKTKKIVKYGPFTVDEINIIVKNLKQKESEQLWAYVYENYLSILYVIETESQKEPLIRDFEWVYVGIACGVGMLVFGISYWENEKLRVVVTPEQLKKKILSAALRDQNILRDLQ